MSRFEWETGVDEEEDWEATQSGKDALIVLIDVRKSMFEVNQEGTWFQSCGQMLMKLLKSKVIANDSSLVGICFFGTVSHLLRCVYDNTIWVDYNLQYRRGVEEDQEY